MLTPVAFGVGFDEWDDYRGGGIVSEADTGEEAGSGGLDIAGEVGTGVEELIEGLDRGGKVGLEVYVELWFPPAFLTVAPGFRQVGDCKDVVREVLEDVTHVPSGKRGGATETVWLTPLGFEVGAIELKTSGCSLSEEDNSFRSILFKRLFKLLFFILDLG